jgi:hypothetical protein
MFVTRSLPENPPDESAECEANGEVYALMQDGKICQLTAP